MNIMAIASGSDNTTWIGTYAGAAVFDNQNKWSATYRQKDGLFNNFVRDIAIDSKGTMWFGNYDVYTQDPGISKKSSTGWKWYSITDGLINAQLKRIAVDKSDRIWIATAAGVSKFTDANEGISEASKIDLQVYPNPAADQLHIDGLTSSGQLVVTSVSGAEMLSSSLNSGTNTITLSSLRSGMYILHCTTNQGTYTGKLVIR